MACFSRDCSGCVMLAWKTSLGRRLPQFSAKSRPFVKDEQEIRCNEIPPGIRAI